MTVRTRTSDLLGSSGKSHEPSAKVALTRIQRGARDLLSVASLPAFCTVMVWLLIALGLWQTSGASSMEPSSSQRLLERWHMMPNLPFNAAMLALAWLLAVVASMAPIVCLRSLGNALYIQLPLSFIVARRILWPGRALVTKIAVFWIAVSQVQEYQLTFSLGFRGTVIAAILASMVAGMVHEDARATEESREFV